MASRPFRVRMSDVLADAFDRDLKKSGYGPRQKGVWVGEALQQLERNDPQLLRCGVGDELDAPRPRSLGIALEREDFSLLQSLVLRFRQGSPLAGRSQGSGGSFSYPKSDPLFLENFRLLGSYPRYAPHN